MPKYKTRTSGLKAVLSLTRFILANDSVDSSYAERYPLHDDIDMPRAFIEKIVMSKEPEQTLIRLIGIAFLVTLEKGLERVRLNFENGKLEYDDLTEKFQAIFESADIGDFQDQDFEECQIVKEYFSILEDFVSQLDLEESQIMSVSLYVQDFLKFQFFDILDRLHEEKAKVSSFLNSKRFRRVTNSRYYDRYLAELKHQYTEVTLNDTKGMTLNYIYQKPNFSLFSKSLTREERKKFGKAAYISASMIGFEDGIHTFVLDWLNGRLKNEALDNENAQILLLYGFPGQGKTSFCKRVIYDLVGQYSIDQPLYMIRFRNLSEPHQLKSEVLGTLHNHLEELHSLSISKDKLGRSLLILDGLDELLMKNNLKTADVDDIMKSLVYEVKLNSNLRILITSRHGYLNHQYLRTNNLLILSLQEFSKSQQLVWLQAYKEFHPESWLKPDKIQEIHQSKNYLHELLGQPILLHMVAALEDDVTQNVDNKAVVYDLLFRQITNPKKWRKGQIDILDGLEPEDLRQALREIAFNIFTSGREYIHKSKIIKLTEVRRLKNTLEDRGGSFRETLKVMMVAFYFQETPKEKGDYNDIDDYDYGIEFLHKSLQEYLTAEYIWSTLREELLSRKPRGYYVFEKDEDILKFLQSIFGHQPMSREIVQYLIEIIQNDGFQEQKQELATRMEDCFAYCLQRQFLYSFGAAQQTKALDLILMVFYGYCIVYAKLKEKIEFLNDQPKETIENFSFLLRILGSSNLPMRLIFLPKIYLYKAVLYYVDLSSADLQYANLNSANLYASDLSYTYLFGADLRNSNLALADLREADLREADLREADLREADLREATIIEVDLRFSNLTNADLSDTNLRGADLHGANLTGANLTGADLSAANLTNCIMDNANLNEAYFLGANLSGVGGLTLKQLASAAAIDGVQGIIDGWNEEIQRIKEKERNRVNRRKK